MRYCLLLKAKMAKLSHASYLLLLLLVVLPGSNGQTELQKHVTFFDKNRDGVIAVSETTEGFRELGFNPVVSGAAALLIHQNLSPKTNNGTGGFLPIIIANIQKGKHGSDSGSYDTEGRFVPQKFEEIFQKHAHANPNALTHDELHEMLNANAQDNDLAGRVASKAEWEFLYTIAKDKDGSMPKETVKSVFDGTLFYEIANQRKN